MEKIDAWNSKKIENYEHVFKEFGLKKFKDYDISDNYLFKRKLIIAHRDFDKIKDAIINKKTFLQLTGIASTGELHFGHKVDVDFFNLFKNLGAKSLFCICDIDGYVSRPDSKIPNINTAKEIAVKNIADLLALGLKPNEIYVQSQKEKQYYQFSYEISKKITSNMFDGVYGHVDLGKVSAVLLQIADILHIQLDFMFGKNPSITGIGLDQDPHARITRDVAKRVNYDLKLPSFFYFMHQSGLKEGTKMSSSDKDTAIFLNDTEIEVKRKINKSFTGGKETVEEQRSKGGSPQICKIYEFFKFHNPKDEFLEDTYNNCVNGKILCGECKQNCIKFINEFLAKHQEKHEKNLEIAKKMVYG
ncbi:MAG: tryptophan--tRNA ligase [Nanoarchaeota archaeon]